MSHRAEPNASRPARAMHCRLAGRLLPKRTCPKVRACLGEGLAHHPVREPEALGGLVMLSAVTPLARTSAVRREPLGHLGPHRHRQAPRLSDRPRTHCPMVARHLEALEAAAQRGSKRRQAEARPMPAPPDAGVGASGAWCCTRPSCVLRSDARRTPLSLAAYFDELARLAPQTRLRLRRAEARGQPDR